MKVQFNPMIEITKGDEMAIKRMNDICEMLICTLAEHTLTDDACIICADSGEVFVTEKELYSTLDVLTRITRITSEAPIDCNARKILAIEFIKQLACISEPCHYSGKHFDVRIIDDMVLVNQNLKF